ncbi:hypothetical protein DPMN_040189 [Dreissena polymorpha]|uniref:Uncharacterized protein n=1 Tax=Dreissena polymorpha TaxID=45954 RepID=A0A9D4CVI5_DREPO|nr:hypothetical protein DPMN_040189 [Dreissena polymorpha]
MGSRYPGHARGRPQGNAETGEDLKGHCRVPRADDVVQQEKNGARNVEAGVEEQTAMYI